jgi:hypothetical protein
MAVDSPWIKLDPKDDAIIEEIDVEHDRGAALIAAALIDERLAQTLNLRLRPKTTKSDKDAHGLLFKRGGGLSSHFARIQLGQLLQLYPPEVADMLVRVNEIRNKFAHETEPISFRTIEIAQACHAMNRNLIRTTMVGDLFLRTATNLVRSPNKRSFQLPDNRFSVTLTITSPITARRVFIQCVKALLYLLAWARDVYANEFVLVVPPPLPGTPSRPSPKPTLRRSPPGTGRQRRPKSTPA